MAVSQRLGEARFGLWFGDGVELGFSGDGDALEVRVPDAFFREWIHRHNTASLLEAAEAVAGRPLRLSIEVRDEAEPPLGDVVEPAPDRAEPEPDAEPRRRQTIKIPMPGNPKAPLSFPSTAPNGPDPNPAPPPGPFPLRRSDRLNPRDRMTGPPGTTGPSAPATAAPHPLRRSDRLNPRDRMTGPPGTTGPSAPATAAPHRPARRLGDFVTGPGNRLAHAAAREMAQSAGAAFNPLVIHSAVGLGKTHLLEGIGHA
jgi:chromosomal replication initiator protein